MTDKPFAQTPQFYGHLGGFYAVWSATELNIDIAIGKIKKLSPEQTHALVARLQFGRKAALLRSLLSKSDYTNVSELDGFLTRIEQGSLRNVFAHSFFFSGPDSITFVHRSSQKKYSAMGYRFKADEFIRHVKQFIHLAHDFEKALAISHDERGKFGKAALPPKTSQYQEV